MGKKWQELQLSDGASIAVLHVIQLYAYNLSFDLV